jgi:hypothetical protein
MMVSPSIVSCRYQICSRRGWIDAFRDGFELESRLEVSAKDFLRERLMVAGYSNTYASQYFRKFEPKERCVFWVSEGFPRLTSAPCLLE